jgi:hypothetical protein
VDKPPSIPMFIDPPAPYEPLENWEEHLRELLELPPNAAGRAQMIDHACKIIAERRQHEPGTLH